MTYTNVIDCGVGGNMTEDIESLIEELRIENEALKLENDRLNRLIAYHVLAEVETK